MSAIDAVNDATSLRFGPISYHLRLPLGLPERDGVTAPACISKARGLVLDIPARVFDIPSDLVIRFNGRPTGADVITWVADQAVTNERVLGIDITHVRGTLVTTASEPPEPAVGDACGVDGGPMNALYNAVLTTVPSQCEVVVATRLGIVTLDPVILSNVTAQVSCGGPIPPLAFSVAIHADHWEPDGCGNRYQLSGATVELTALLSRLGAVGGATTHFEWSVSGPAVLLDGTTDRTCRVSFPDRGTVEVTVRVRVATPSQPEASSRATLRFRVVTAEELDELRQQCRLQRLVDSTLVQRMVTLVRGARGGTMIGGQLFVDPLWDPTPDLLRSFQRDLLQTEQPLFTLYQTRQSAQRIAKAATELEKQTSKAIAPREAQFAAMINNTVIRKPLPVLDRGPIIPKKKR